MERHITADFPVEENETCILSAKHFKFAKSNFAPLLVVKMIICLQEDTKYGDGTFANKKKMLLETLDLSQLALNSLNCHKADYFREQLHSEKTKAVTDESVHEQGTESSPCAPAFDYLYFHFVCHTFFFFLTQ